MILTHSFALGPDILNRRNDACPEMTFPVHSLSRAYVCAWADRRDPATLYMDSGEILADSMSVKPTKLGDGTWRPLFQYLVYFGAHLGI